ncbi:TonB-dependent receptor [Synoicihabitans lomoniglobus]|uniref:TonB-dependent receptor n=1 Tax=Synoicihabitans lomoniglobus TaxID=2909285 RepID=A0AAF0CMT7_9BACT|nr:TonB-dependent receptor [Opitutaceae bacterium LMO-M01]WED64623.1 TonB-dependent receptor [Opitutaceae bacterium LMO-M01]
MPVRPRLSLCLLPFLTHLLAAQVLDPLVVTATRAPRPLSELPVAVDVFTSADLAASPALSIDDALKSSAAFSLFRRQGSLAANPTTQGVSLRNLGPNGAGRTLVLVDGVPLNDPFGGWVAWTKAPRLSLTAAEIVRGGGSSTWGSAALGGTVQLFGPASAGPDASMTRIQFEAGEYGTVGGELAHTTVNGANAFTLNARALHSDGYRRAAPASSGPVDRSTDLDLGVVQLGWTHTTEQGTRGTVTARLFREERGNGTPLQRNRTEEALVSAHVTGRRDLLGRPADWTATAYAQTQEFSNRFTSVADDRASEIAVLDQYAVPADAAGAATTATWSDRDQSTTVGADARWVSGETRENYFRSGDDFIRNRRAGGEQTIAGVFVHHDRVLATDWRGSLAARVDAWQLGDGHRIETDRTNGAIVRSDTLPDRDGVEFSPRAGLVWQATSAWRFHGAVYSAFRVPTLNELYRPFRIGSDITEANPELAPESLRGIEVGTTWATTTSSLRLNLFANELEDAVSNVTLGTGPGVVPGVGFVPAGGLGRRRENLEQVDVRGVEITGTWRPDPALSLRFDYLFSDARNAATDRWLPQVPEHTVVMGAGWVLAPDWTLNVQGRYLSAAFEDDENSLVLNAVTTIDLRIAKRLGEGREVFLAVENVFDEDVITRRDSSGRIELGTPRFSRVGLTWQW